MRRLLVELARDALPRIVSFVGDGIALAIKLRADRKARKLSDCEFKGENVDP